MGRGERRRVGVGEIGSCLLILMNEGGQHGGWDQRSDRNCNQMENEPRAGPIPQYLHFAVMWTASFVLKSQIWSLGHLLYLGGEDQRHCFKW